MDKNSIFDQKIKQMTFNKLSDADKDIQRKKILEGIFLQLTNKENRYLFYCPDIMVINNLTKLIYETAYAVQKLGYKVVVLHEINGFKCKWLFEDENYKHLKELDVDYIIKEKSKKSKSKKSKADYAFKPSDTLIVPDHFQEMLDNLVDVKLIQRVVLVSSYTGLSVLSPGTDYNTLGVSRLLFVEKKLQEDYKNLFTFESTLIDKYPINQIFSKDQRKPSEVYPNFCISNIGNNDLTQEVINIFYNKYPQLRTFTFKIIPRDNFGYYIDTLKHSALFLVLDKTLGNTQMIKEALNMGIPVGTYWRREIEGELEENIFFGRDGFEIADNLAEFAQAWLNLKTSTLEEGVSKFVNNLGLEEHTYENFSNQLHDAIKELQDSRVKYFTGLKQSMEKIESDKEAIPLPENQEVNV